MNTYLDLGRGTMGELTGSPDRQSIKERYSGINPQQVAFEAILLRPGLVMVSIKQAENQHLAFNFEVDRTFLSATYCLTGEGSTTYTGNHRKPETISMSPSTGVFSFFPNSWGTTSTIPGSPKQFLRLFIEPGLFFDYLGDDIDLVPKDISTIYDDPDQSGLVSQFHLCHQEQSIVHQLLNSPFQGAAKRFVLEGGALELFGYATAKLKTDNKRKKDPSLSKNDVEALYYARSLLFKDLAQPPTIMQLAQLTGLNEFKLKNGFRKLFSSSIYQYFQNNRMSRAKCLLQQGSLNVSSVAWEVGYTNVSHFIAAFKKKYGINPGNMLKEVKRLGR
ncbi:MAG: AraC family transcriptional regulator [Proteobacteria bacterium]|nr:AraC family transcriptional regulator [Pseudomonadota bacterium]